MAKTNHAVVVDASVAKAAGDASEHPVSTQCREALLAIKATKLSFITGGLLRDEWKKHQSGFARTWLLSMIARGRFVCLTDLDPNPQLRDAIAKNAGSQNSAAAMDKDAHLLEIALLSSRRVVALDEVVRGLFRALCAHHIPIESVMWANPVVPADETVKWLLAGAPGVKNLTLGHKA